MRILRHLLILSIAATCWNVAKPAWADVRKEQVFTLGVHLGNVNGTLYGLNTSYDRSKKAHPGAVPLLKRQMRWSIDLAKALKLPTGDLEALDRDLESLEFDQMDRRLQPILNGMRTSITATYNAQAARIFDLGTQLTLAGGATRRALNDLPERREPFRTMTANLADQMLANITINKLEATASLASDLAKRTRGGEDFISLETFMAQILRQWTEDFRKAPGWTGGGVLVTNLSSRLTTSDARDRERKNCYARVHTVNLNAGVTYTVDVESGNGSTGPEFFDVWLRIEDSMGRTILNNDDGGEGFNSRATFRPTASGTYRMVVTSYRQNATGAYTLKVRQ